MSSSSTKEESQIPSVKNIVLVHGAWDRTIRLVTAQDGPTLLVGHSYGGAVIS